MVFIPRITLQGRHYHSSFTELEKDSDLQFASSLPAVQTKGYQILKVHGLLATPQGVCENLSLSLEWIYGLRYGYKAEAAA